MSEYQISKTNLQKLYVTSDPVIIASQLERYQHVTSVLEITYGRGISDVRFYSAPGRTEICGNHTDHQHGEVLAAALNVDMIAAVQLNNLACIRILSEGYPAFEIELTDLTPRAEERGSTSSLVRGVLFYLSKRCDCRLQGFDAVITSNVLTGSGLSSSAAFEALIGTIVSNLLNGGIVSPIQIALAGQFAENQYFGKPCGLMDQMASAVGGLVNIDFRNADHPSVKNVNYDFTQSGYSILITNTGGSHSNLTSEYKAITDEMHAIAQCLGHEYLRDIDELSLIKNFRMLREQVGDRAVLRALHFVNENKRVSVCVDCLKEGDFASFLDLVRESGNSSYKYLQNIYKEGDTLHREVALALGLSENWLKVRNAGVCRVHGGGFAGTVQAFVKDEFATDYRDFMNCLFGSSSCFIYKIRELGGCEVEKG